MIDSDCVEYPEEKRKSIKKTGIFNNTDPIRLTNENPDIDCELVDKMLEKVDLRKIKSKKKENNIVLEDDQFVLVGFTKLEVLKRKIKNEFTETQERILNFSNEIYNEMRSDEKGNGSLFELYTQLADLIVSIEKIKRTINC